MPTGNLSGRVLLASGLASLVILGAILLVTFRTSDCVPEAGSLQNLADAEQGLAGRTRSKPETASGQSDSQAETGIQIERPPQQEKPIEELLAESGEDPGAVFYMSRVREAMREGNPKFARELLGQMRKLHSQSVLIHEAESLIEEAK